MRLWPLYITVLLLITTFCYGEEGFRLEEQSFKSADYNETILHVEKRDYYSISVTSKTGSRISLIDRMAGELDSDGSVGRRDGRVDRLLDKGEYKIRLFIPEKEQAELQVTPYSEANRATTVEKLPYLEEHKLISTNLMDLEKRSYWLYQAEKGPLHLEVMGRTLQQVTLWKDGQLLVDTMQKEQSREIEKGRPMGYIELYGNLEPGYYLVIMSGGPKREWANENNLSPLHIRRGIPYIGESNRMPITISPFGRDSFITSQDSNYFQLSRRDKVESRLYLDDYSSSRSRLSWDKKRSITKTSDDPWCEIHNSYSSGRSLVSVEGMPGDEVELTYFEKADSYSFYRSKSYSANFWVSSLSSSNARHSLDLTPMLLTYKRSKITDLKNNTIRVGDKKPFVRKVNLMGANTAYIYVERKGTYKVFEDDKAGAAAKYRFVLMESPSVHDERYSDRIKSGEEVELVAGFYRLEIEPIRLGILHFALLKDETVAGIFGRGGAEKTARSLLQQTPPEPNHSFFWSDIFIDNYNNSYNLLYNNRKNIVTGLVVRELPLDLDEPLPVTLKAGESARIKVKVKANSRIFINGEGFTLTENSKSYNNGSTISAGQKILTLTNNNVTNGTGGNTTFYSIRTEPIKRGADEPPRIKELTEIYPIITADKPYYGDFERDDRKGFILRVNKPGFYSLETTGRLAFSMNVRTATVISLYEADRNGVGRNALMQSYLKAGDYLVEVTTMGRSMGRGGLRLKRVEELDGGSLPPGTISGKVVDADRALIYTLPVEERDTYVLDVYGRESNFSYRFEDSEGWPVSQVITRGVWRGELLPRTYRLFSLPLSLRTRRLTRFVQVEKQPQEPGEGEYNLFLNQERNIVWEESEERAPHIFHLNLTAPLKGHLSLSDGMRVEVYRKGELIQAGTGKDGLDLDLEMGLHLLRVRSIEKDNYRKYRIEFSSTEIMPGESRNVRSFPAELTVSIGEERITDIWSYGKYDYKATLWSEDRSQLIASNDDSNSNWNFFISTKLQPGRYKLLIEKMAGSSGNTTVTVRSREMRSGKGQRLPFTLSDELGSEVADLTLSGGSKEQLYHVKAASSEKVRLALYSGERLIAAGHNSIYIPLRANVDYRLQYWHDSNEQVKMQISAQPVGESTLKLSGAGEMQVKASSLKVENRSGLSYYFSAAGRELLYSPAADQPCYPVTGRPEITGEGQGWLVSADGKAIGNLDYSPLNLVESRAVTVRQDENAHSFRVEHSGEEVLLLELLSQGSLTGVTIRSEKSYQPDQLNWEGMEIDSSVTYTGIGEAGSYQGRLWNILPEATGEQLSLLLKSYPVSGSKELEGQSTTLEVDPQQAVIIQLKGRDAREYRLLLAQGMVLYHWEDESCQTIVTALKGNRSHTISAAGGKLVLINRGKKRALTRVERMGKAGELYKELGPGTSYEAITQQRGELLFEVENDRNHPLICAAGEVDEILLLGNDGRYYYPEWDEKAGIYIMNRSNGWLKVRHRAGLLKIWLASHETIEENFVESGKRGGGKDLVNGSVYLSSAEELWKFTMKEAGYVTIETDSPGFIALYDGNTILAAEAGSKGRAIFHYLEPGSYKVLTRPVRGAGQEGPLRLKRVFPEEVDGESEERRFIAPGEIQAFRFSVKKDNKVGVGLRTESDSLTAALYDDSFNLIKRGTLIISDLTAGDYLLVVEAGEEAVQYSPLLLGLDGSRMEIPRDVVKKYEGR